MNTQPTPPSPQKPSPHHPMPASFSIEAHKHWIWIALTGFVLLLLVAGGIFAAYYLQSPQRAERLLAQRVVDLKSAEMQLLIVPDTTSTQQQQIRVIGAYNNQDPQQRKARMSLQVMPSPDATTPTVDTEMVSINDLLYLRFQRLPNFGALNFNNSTQQWIKIDTKNPPLLLKALGFFPQQQNTSSTTLKQAYITHPFFRLERKVGETTAQGVEVGRYPVQFDQPQFDAFVQEMLPLIQQRVGKGIHNTQVSKLTDTIKGVSGEVWIGKVDHFPYRIQLSVLREGDVVTTIVIDFLKHNQPISIDAPAQSQSIDSMLQLLLGQTKKETTTTTDDETRLENPALDSDDDGLTNGEEKNWLTDPLNPDSDEDGFMDGEEVEQGYNPSGPGKIE